MLFKAKITAVHFILVCQTLFNVLLVTAETYMMCINMFYVVRNKISAGYNKIQRFSNRPTIVKITHFGNVMSIDMTLPKGVNFTHDVAKVSNFYNEGLWEKCSF